MTEDNRHPTRLKFLVMLCGIPFFCSANAGFFIASARSQTLPTLPTLPTSESIWSQVRQSADLQTQVTVAAIDYWLRNRTGQVPPSPLPNLLTPLLLPPVTTDGAIVDKLGQEAWDTYRLSPGDAILIRVEPPFQNLSFQGNIGPEGNIILPLLGVVKLSELSPEEAAAQIQQSLNRFLVNPIVSLTLLARSPILITVTGEVTRPGFYLLGVAADDTLTVDDALLVSGGARLNADLRQVRVRRPLPNGLILEREVDLYRPLETGDPLPDLLLQEGDVVVVPSRPLDFDSNYDIELVNRSILTGPPQQPLQVTIVGEVARPGFYPLSPAPPPTLAQVLLTAGGTKVTANLRRVQVRRTLADDSVIEEEVDLFTPLLEGEPLPEIRLEEGDVVIVPQLEIADQEEYDRQLAARSTLAQQQINVRVLSYASTGRRGGAGGTFRVLTLPNTSTLVDALQGVPLNQADLDSVALVRFDEQLGRAVTQEFDVEAAMTGDFSQNVSLQDNDVIIVDRNLIANIGNFLNTFTQPFRDVLGFLLFFDRLTDSADNLFGP